MNKDIYQSIQIRAQEHTGAIIKIFDALLKHWPLCKGFIGFENSQGMISIFHASSDKEKYYHLNREAGFTGHVYATGAAAIFDHNNKTHTSLLEVPTDEAKEFSEMVATIHYRKSGETVEKAGVILLDKLGYPEFTEDDLSKLKKAAKNIGDILSNVNPWKLRSWSANYGRTCTQEYKSELESELKKRLSKYQGISLKTELVDGGNLLSPVYFHSSTKEGSDYKKVSDRVLQLGTSHYNPDLVTQGVLGVPFPMNGPIKGVISVERLQPKTNEKDESLEIDEIRKDVIDVIESLQYPLFRKVYDTNEAGIKMFSFLNKCNSTDKPLIETLNELCREFGEIDDASIEVYLPSQVFGDMAGESELIRLIEHTKLHETFVEENDTSSRPKFWIRKEGDKEIIKCAVYNGTRLVGGIKTTPKTEEISQSDSDGPIVEIFATFIGKLLARHLRLRAWAELLECVQTSKLSDENVFLSKGIEILQCNYLISIKLKNASDSPSDQGVSEIKMKSSDNKDRRLIEEDEVGNFLKLLNPKFTKVMIMNNTDSLEELRKSKLITSVNKLRSEMSAFRVRALLIHRVDTSNILMGVIHREKSFKRLFDKEDENNMATLVTLYGLLFSKSE